MLLHTSRSIEVGDSPRLGGSRRRMSAKGKSERTLPILCILVAAIELAALGPGVNGEVFAVGGAAGWTVPHKGKVNYTEWAAMLSSLNVGDTLLFTYSEGEHNVVQVGEDDFDRCRSENAFATFTDGQSLVNLPREGQYWFICGFAGHCALGQKFAVDVVGSTSPGTRATAPAPAPSPGALASGPPLEGGGAVFPPALASTLAPHSPAPDNSSRPRKQGAVGVLVLFSILLLFPAIGLPLL